MENSRILFLFVFVTFIVAQPNKVSQIQIVGNETTKDYIIRREIQHPVSQPLDSALASADRDRIDNLGIFSHVSWEVIPQENNEAILRYLVVESWMYLPAILPIYGEEYGWIFSWGLIVSNFRGRNQTLSMGGEFGGRSAYGLEYSDPWIFGDHISLSVSIGKNFWAHPFLPVEMSIQSAEVTVGRYFGYKLKTYAGMEFEEQSLSDGALFRTVSPQIRTMYDTRDVYADPSRGIAISQFLQWDVNVLSEGRNRFFWEHSYSAYQTLVSGKKRLVGGANISGRFMFGDGEHHIWKKYVGGAESIRGWTSPDTTNFIEDQFRFGVHTLTTSVELRQTVIPRHSTRLGTDFGLTAVGFVDIGVADETVSGLLKKKPLLGFGIGLRFPIAILQTLRFDYGWGWRDGQWTGSALHFSIGHKF